MIKTILDAYKQAFSGLILMVLSGPFVLLLVAILTLLAKYCYKVVLFVWG